MYLGHLIPAEHDVNIITIHNPPVLKKSFVKALKTAKNGFHVIKMVYPEICTFKTPHFRVLRFAGFNHGAAEPL